jgi:hypothetical protein
VNMMFSFTLIFCGYVKSSLYLTSYLLPPHLPADPSTTSEEPIPRTDPTFPIPKTPKTPPPPPPPPKKKKTPRQKKASQLHPPPSPASGYSCTASPPSPT